MHTDLTEVKLNEVKPLVKLFGLDYDGTVSDGVNYKQTEVFALVEKILDKSKSVAFITARAATALKTLVPPFQELLDRKNVTSPQFIAGGNGATLYEVKKDELVLIYNHGFNLAQIKHVVNIGRKVYEELGIEIADLSEKGLDTFGKFLKDDWTGFISSEIMDVCRPYNGGIFTEETKVTFVLPKDRTLHQQLIAGLNEKLGEEFYATAGDDTYVHITRKLEKDSKRVAIETILDRMGLKENQVATFGDMPIGNDVGLLSFPYSFTNSEEFITAKTDVDKPPYILINSNLFPIARVYEAVDYLLE